jgi:hypothetical protein
MQPTLANIVVCIANERRCDFNFMFMAAGVPFLDRRRH